MISVSKLCWLSRLLFSLVRRDLFSFCSINYEISIDFTVITVSLWQAGTSRTWSMSICPKNAPFLFVGSLKIAFHRWEFVPDIDRPSICWYIWEYSTQTNIPFPIPGVRQRDRNIFVLSSAKRIFYLQISWSLCEKATLSSLCQGRTIPRDIISNSIPSLNIISKRIRVVSILNRVQNLTQKLRGWILNSFVGNRFR